MPRPRKYTIQPTDHDARIQRYANYREELHRRFYKTPAIERRLGAELAIANLEKLPIELAIVRVERLYFSLKNQLNKR